MNDKHFYGYSRRTGKSAHEAELTKLSGEVAELRAQLAECNAANRATEDLYDALTNLLARVRYDCDARAWFLDEQEAARAALAKARGEVDDGN